MGVQILNTLPWVLCIWYSLFYTMDKEVLYLRVHNACCSCTQKRLTFVCLWHQDFGRLGFAPDTAAAAEAKSVFFLRLVAFCLCPHVANLFHNRCRHQPFPPVPFIQSLFSFIQILFSFFFSAMRFFLRRRYIL